MRRRVAKAISHCSIRAIDDTGASWVFYSWYGLFVLGVDKKPKLISGKKTHWVHKLRKTFRLVTGCLAENLEHGVKASIGED